MHVVQPLLCAYSSTMQWPHSVRQGCEIRLGSCYAKKTRVAIDEAEIQCTVYYLHGQARPSGTRNALRAAFLAACILHYMLQIIASLSSQLQACALVSVRVAGEPEAHWSLFRGRPVRFLHSYHSSMAPLLACLRECKNTLRPED